MRIVKNVLAAAAFTILAAVVFGFDLTSLFSAGELAIFALGTLLFCVPAADFANRRLPEPEVIGEAALYAGLLQAFLQLFAALNSPDSAEAFPLTIALNVRPVFYGLLVRAVLTGIGKNSIQNQPAESPPSTVEYVCSRFIQLGLTRREAEVASLACKGLANCEIALELTISEATVKKHISNIFTKLGITRREQLRALIFPHDIIN